MSKSIKVSEDVYNLLLEIQRPGETLSAIIMRVIKASILMLKVEPLIRSQHDFLEEKIKKLNAEEAAHG